MAGDDIASPISCASADGDIRLEAVQAGAFELDVPLQMQTSETSSPEGESMTHRLNSSSLDGPGTRRHQRPVQLPFALDPSSSRWQDPGATTQCPLCYVEIDATLKHTRRRHCRRCGDIFCYMCTYDKSALLQRKGSGFVGGLVSCLPCLVPPTPTQCHVCLNCYDELPPPADLLRRCRFCGQKVRLHVYSAHASVCEERHQRACRPGAPSAPRLLLGLLEEDEGGHVTSNGHVAEGDLPAGTAGPGDPLRISVVEELPDSLVCKICLTREANALIRKCGHAVACVYCIEKCDTCPVCRKPIKEVLRIFRQ